MTVRTKLLLITFSSLLGFVVAAGFVAVGFVRLEGARQLESAAYEASDGWNRLNVELKDSMLRTESISSLSARLDDSLAEFVAVFESFLALQDSPWANEDQREQLGRLSELWNLNESAYREIVTLMNTLVDKGIDSQTSSRGLIRYYGESLVSREVGDKGIWEVGRISELQNRTSFASETFVNNILTFLADVREDSRRTTTTLFAAAGAVVVLSMILALFLLGGFNRRLVARLRSVEDVMNRLASQDLTRRAVSEGKDELADLGRHVNRTVEGLTGFLRQVQEATTRVSLTKDTVSSGTTESSAALEEISRNLDFIKEQVNLLNADIQQSGLAIREIDDTVGDLFEQINSQSASIDTSSGSIGQMTNAIAEITTRTRTNHENAMVLQDSVSRGGDEVEQSVAIIEEIAHDVSDIKEILDIIQAISDQTNLLSMNAAIESAHAGEAGRGFAVVAEEIRNLSNTTAENTHRVEAVLRQVVERIDRAKSAGADTLEAFEVIKKTVAQISGNAEEIAKGMDNLSDGSQSLRAETGEITAITERIGRGARIMKDRSGQLSDTLSAVSDVSTSVLGGTEEIDSGAKEILDTMLHIKAAAEENRRDMEILDGLMGEFTMDDQPDQKQA